MSEANERKRRMKRSETACVAKGFVAPSLTNVVTGEKIPFELRHNTLSYTSAEAMAAAFGGNPSYIPARVGFIYGGSGSAIDGAISRSQSWDALMDQLKANDADIQVVSFSYSPSLGGEKPDSSSSESDSSSDPGGDYSNIKPGGSNAVTFHAVSNSQDVGERDKTKAFGYGDSIYQAVLLGLHDGKYYVLSRVSLADKSAGYLKKPENFEVALDWTVVFR